MNWHKRSPKDRDQSLVGASWGPDLDCKFRLRPADLSGWMQDSLEQEEESTAQEFNFRTQANVFIEESEQVRDIGEGQHQERLLQLTEEEAKRWKE